MKSFIRKTQPALKILRCVRCTHHIHANKHTNMRPVVTVIGAGPAGFGLTQFLLKNSPAMLVNMIEKFPVPYGLVRYGVSPDHQDVKNCINGYEKVAKNPRFAFYGGVAVGGNVSLDDLMSVSDGVVFCTGAQGPVTLGIPGENLRNVFTAKEFVGWYNGEADYERLSPDLSGQTAVIVGVGNVALDCARMLLKPVLKLKNTDVTNYSYKTLEESKIRNVIMIGRRGPLQMACTRRELSEVVELDDVATFISSDYFTQEVKEALAMKHLKLRKTQRLVTYLMKSADFSNMTTKRKTFTVKLLRSPLAIRGHETVNSMLLGKNIVFGNDAFMPEIIDSFETEEISCSLVISAIGYRNTELDNRIPYHSGRAQTHRGRIEYPYPLYACGWCRTGPKGVLGDTLNDCLVTGSKIVEDVDFGKWNVVTNKEKLGSLLQRKNIRYFSWKHWKTIDKHELRMGLLNDKIREKVVSWKDMSKVAFGC